MPMLTLPAAAVPIYVERTFTRKDSHYFILFANYYSFPPFSFLSALRLPNFFTRMPLSRSLLRQMGIRNTLPAISFFPTTFLLSFAFLFLHSPLYKPGQNKTLPWSNCTFFDIQLLYLSMHTVRQYIAHRNIFATFIYPLLFHSFAFDPPPTSKGNTLPIQVYICLLSPLTHDQYGRWSFGEKRISSNGCSKLSSLSKCQRPSNRRQRRLS